MFLTDSWNLGGGSVEGRDIEKMIPQLHRPRYFNYFTDEQDSRMYDSANERAQCISSGTCEFTHDGWTLFVGRHVRYVTAGEVLARDYDNWGEVMDAWYDSETHRDVLMREWCVYGAARSADIFVMHFACE